MSMWNSTEQTSAKFDSSLVITPACEHLLYVTIGLAVSLGVGITVGTTRKRDAICLTVLPINSKKMSEFCKTEEKFLQALSELHEALTQKKIS